MTTIEEARADAIHVAEDRPQDQVLERLAEQIGAKARVQAVFGEPIRQGDRTVIPVARVRWGFGGGAGRSEADQAGTATGSGGGGGVSAEPIGYLELTDDEAEFRPITDARPSAGFLLAAGIAAALVIRAIGRVVGR
jgi:uncharacterized spore protein YtfJ